MKASVSNIDSIYCAPSAHLDTFTDVLIELGIKTCTHLLEVSIFSLNQVIVRPTEIIKDLSVKPVHKHYLCTGFKEVLNNFGRSADDMIYDIFTRFIHGFIPNSHKKS